MRLTKLTVERKLKIPGRKRRPAERTNKMTTTINFDDPAERLALIERVGHEAYNLLLEEHKKKSIVAIVAGRAIRPVMTGFGRLFMVEGTNMAFRTLDEAKAHATANPLEPEEHSECGYCGKDVTNQEWITVEDEHQEIACIKCAREKKLPGLTLENFYDYEAIMREAQDAFWDVILKHIPAESGDFGPEESHHFDQACLCAIRTWTRWNGTEVPRCQNEACRQKSTDEYPVGGDGLCSACREDEKAISEGKEIIR